MKIITKIATKGARTKLTLVLYILLAVGAGFLLLYANDLLAQALNDYLMVQNFDGFGRQLLLTAGLFALVYGLNAVGVYLRADFQYTAYVLRWPRYYIERLIRAKHSYFTNRPAAELFTSLWTASQATGHFYGNVLAVVSRIIIFIFYGIVVFRLNVFAGIFTLAALPVYFLLTAGMGNRVSSLNQAYVPNVSEFAAVTQETFENVSNVKAKNAYVFFVSRSAAIMRKIKSICVRLSVIEGYISAVTGLVRIIAPLIIILGAMYFSTGFEANAGNIMVLYINIPLFLSGFADIHRGYIDYKMSKPFLAKLQEFNNVEPEYQGGIHIISFESLRTENVQVEFEGGRVISVPDFYVKRGEKVMFFGESGIGKSTVFNIIMGFTEYTGDVLINGINLREISLVSVRKIFGITFQHTNALTLGLRENILLGTEKTQDALSQLIQLAELESQWDTKGETILNNKVLSGGEKSRIGLSQMLALQPQIMLIDEAFSNMDEALESKIITNLFRIYPNCAVICISHRNSSKPLFDRVVDFNHFGGFN
ncbi:MAG: ABC transporter ATP-binding protein/permease [Defluviitaleaceae bacterium]|nr:ABC transporter ATP-binding protein/permease [Defluviitaleaceae bacterium]MCL2274014.1 ABC transporter ATP-binding protein/permease [Defluviitaleaceae bacterium]MCL2274085.1 ABC transporter ATP-binding protein/permease [Defluviitaleaceae bacterium]